MVKSLTSCNAYPYDEPIVDVKLKLNWDRSLEFVLKNPDASIQEYGNYFRRIANTCVPGADGTGITIDDANGICYSLDPYVESLRDHLRKWPRSAN
jgi:hypothetical protein